MANVWWLSDGSARIERKFELESEATPADILSSAASLRRARIEVDNAVLLHAVAWAGRNGPETIHPDQLHIRGGARPVQLGGDNTPEVNDLAPAELGVALGLSTGAAAGLVADSLDLRHRLPNLWATIVDCTLPGWQGRKIAQHTRALTAEQAAQVDRRLAGYAGTIAWTRLERFLDAVVADIDATNAEKEAEMAQHRRGTWTGQSNAHGIKTLYARMDACDAIRLLGQVNRVADTLRSRGLAGNADTRRATALGILADPIQATWLLTHHTQPHLFADAPTGPAAADGTIDDSSTSPGTATPTRPATPTPTPVSPDELDHIPEGDIHPSQHDLPGDQPDNRDYSDRAQTGGDRLGHLQNAGTPSQLEAFQTAIGRIVSELDLNQLRPTTQLIVHTAAETLQRGHGTLRCQTSTPRRRPPAGDQQPIRVEDLGPLTLPTVRNRLLHHRITLRPVIDLNHPPPPVDTYEIPTRHRHHVALRHPASMFCWTTSAQGLDLDHVHPYLAPDNGRPPGQTRLHNLVPLSRREHRLFTHARWQRRQPQTGTLLIRTPHGHILLTNNTGTHDLGNATHDTFAHTIWNAA